MAKSLKVIFEDISHNGYCYERIHNYIEISFCMPQKVFKRLNPCLEVEPESIWNCLEALRPYHGILLLYEERELLDKLPLDAVPTLKKMLAHASPTKSFRTIASDSDLALLHVSTVTTVRNHAASKKRPIFLSEAERRCRSDARSETCKIASIKSLCKINVQFVMK